MKEKPIKIPKRPAECADLLYSTRKDRLELQKQVEQLKKLEAKLTEHFINTIPVSDSRGVAGKVALVTLEPKDVPVVDDWDALYAYVKRTGSFELLQKRLGEGAVKERWEQKKKVPGVGVFHAKVVSVTKL